MPFLLPLSLSRAFSSFLFFTGIQEIRQLRMKHDGLNREISDLQETVEWKDKKIGVGPVDANLLARWPCGC